MKLRLRAQGKAHTVEIRDSAPVAALYRLSSGLMNVPHPIGAAMAEWQLACDRGEMVELQCDADAAADSVFDLVCGRPASSLSKGARTGQSVREAGVAGAAVMVTLMDT